MIRFLFRLAALAGAGALVKKAVDARAAKAQPASAGPTPPPAAAPESVRATPPADAPGPAPDDDPLVAEEEAAAAAEAGAIGGPGVDDAHGDPALEPVYEAGGGEAEGFEAAEEELVDNASHGGGRGDPIRDAMTPEVESDESTAVEGDADEIIESDDRKA